MSTTRRHIAVLLLCCGAVLSGAPASAQYFGQNKVHYQTFDFQVLKTEHFDIYFYPREEEGARLAARMAERWYARLRELLDHELRGRQPLILYASHVDFEQTNVVGGVLGEGTGGVTEGLRRRIVMPLAGPLAETDHVLGHELVHAFQFDMTTVPGAAPGTIGASRLPLWFIEGMAEYLSIGHRDPNTTMWLRDAAARERLPRIKDLDKPEYFPYRWGQAFWAYVSGRFGDGVIPRLLRTGTALPLDKALEEVLGVTEEQLSKDWHAAILSVSAPVLTAVGRELEGRDPLVQGRPFSAELNVGPALSPDGRWLAFISTRSLLSVDIFIADTSNGRVVRKLTSTATDPHFSSIQFIHSAGAWDRSSRRLAVATVADGRPALAIYDALEGSLEREIEIPDVDEILAPAWAPDDSAIAFSGLRGGLMDLYLYDLQQNRLRRLTTDAFADLQPSWSPDGQRLAFSTDRFTADTATLSFGEYQLGVLDVASGRIDRVGNARGKQINPHWAPDGASIYFISDREGVSNVYRVTTGSGEIVQVTTIGTGVSGITGLSPALAVASRAGTVAFTVYQGGTYSIYTVTGSTGGAPRQLAVDAATLPPLQRRTSAVTALLEQPSQGLPSPSVAASDPVEPYKASLQLEGVIQPSVGVGVSRYGSSIGGGVALAFSDLLRNHSLTTAVQVNSTFGQSTSLKDVGAQVAYFNAAKRWNWGVVGGQVPYLSGGFQSGVGRLPNGDVVQTDQLFVFRQTERSITGVTSYPLSRAQRVEFSGGVTNISFDQIVTTTTFSLVTGQILDDSSETTPIGSPLTLGMASAAYVFDTSVFGATSPVQGQRYRFEVSPTMGSLRFTGFLADYRRYFMPARFYTIAVRAMHFGRYGSGSQDQRILPLDIGYPWLVRGYDIGNITSEECPIAETATTITGCALIDRLLGSRMLVGNVELRFPLMRPFGAEQNMYGPLPMEVALFADSGTAWSGSERPSFLGGSRDGVVSAGVALRVNLFGFAVGEFNYSRPFQRPARGWIFGFNLMPGW
jgi:Tol biopolymer transport system component